MAWKIEFTLWHFKFWIWRPWFISILPLWPSFDYLPQCWSNRIAWECLLKDKSLPSRSTSSYQQVLTPFTSGRKLKTEISLRRSTRLEHHFANGSWKAELSWQLLSKRGVYLWSSPNRSKHFILKQVKSKIFPSSLWNSQKFLLRYFHNQACCAFTRAGTSTTA